MSLLVLGTLTGMQYHKLTEHFDEKPFSCEECGAKFAANSTLKNHLRLHTGDRPFMCKHCLMTFTQASALAYHTKKKHSEGEVDSVFCLLQTFLGELPQPIPHQT
jgi:zinc finger/BTB domain-containing protein 40